MDRPFWWPEWEAMQREFYRKVHRQQLMNQEHGWLTVIV